MSEQDELSADDANAGSPNPEFSAHAEEAAEPTQAPAPPIPARSSLETAAGSPNRGSGRVLRRAC